MFLFSLFLLSFKHIWLNREHSLSVVKKFRPLDVNGNLLSTTGVDRYVTAILLLSDVSTDRNAILQYSENEAINLLIFDEEIDVLLIDGFLWSPQVSKKKSIENFIHYLMRNSYKPIKYSIHLYENDINMLNNF